MCMYKAPKNETELVFGVFSFSSWDNVTPQVWCFYPLISQSLNLVSPSD